MTVANHVLSFGGHLTMILVMRSGRLHSSDFRYGLDRALVRVTASGTACETCQYQTVMVGIKYSFRTLL